MPSILFNAQFLLIAATNLFLFLVVATWSFLSVVIVELGGDKVDVGLVMGSIGLTSLGSLPVVAPLIDRYGRKLFISGGILVIGLSNGAFLIFDSYSPLLILVRLVQGIAFAACFNGCATAIVDMVPVSERGQGIGLFGVSGSIAVAIGPFLGERVLITWGKDAYFLLLVVFGIIGFVASLRVKEVLRSTSGKGEILGFFPTAVHGGHLSMMIVAGIFGSGFAAMNTFFPLHAKYLGIQAGLFFVCYGVTLFAVRLLLGSIADRVDRGKLVLGCMLGFGLLLVSTSQISSAGQSAFLGGLFGILQGLSYPAMMARMVDRSNDSNRAVVVALFTGSFGVGINASVLAWGFIAKAHGLAFMFMVGGLLMFITSAVCAWLFLGYGHYARSGAEMAPKPTETNSLS